MFKLKTDPSQFEARKNSALKQMRERHAFALSALSPEGRAANAVSESDFHMAAELLVHGLDSTMATLQDHVQRATNVAFAHSPAATSLMVSGLLSAVTEQIDMIVHDLLAESYKSMSNVELVRITPEELMDLLGVGRDPDGIVATPKKPH